MESARRYEGDSRPSATEPAVKEKAASSLGSHEGRTESGEGESSGSCSWGRGREEIFLFFKEDVLTASCPGSSRARWRKLKAEVATLTTKTK